MAKSKTLKPNYRFAISFEASPDVDKAITQVKQQGRGAIKLYVERLIREDWNKRGGRAPVIAGLAEASEIEAYQ